MATPGTIPVSSATHELVAPRRSAYARGMWRAEAIGAVLAVLAWTAASWADIIPEPEEGNRYIERTVHIDPSALPEGTRMSLSLVYGKTKKSHDDWPPDKPIPDPVNATANLHVSNPNGSCYLPMPELMEVTIAVDPRAKSQARYRPKIVDGKLEPGFYEVVFFDEAGTVVCRRPPIDGGLDPCDLGAPWKRWAHFARRYLLIPAVLVVVLLACGWTMRRLRRRRASGRPCDKTRP